MATHSQVHAHSHTSPHVESTGREAATCSAEPSHGCGCSHVPPALGTIGNLARYRRVLWIALVLNAAMFVVELVGAERSGSVSLLADSIDFAGDAMNYGVSLAVLSAVLAVRAKASLVKAVSMIGFGVFVLGAALWRASTGTPPEPVTMGVVGFLALAVNVGVAAMLYAWREGDANMRSVWLCSRNDALGNLAVMGAALGVFGTGSAWPDLIVAALMATLALRSGATVWMQARRELAAG
jgi:Co/Zn/Cd efflux system component